MSSSDRIAILKAIDEELGIHEDNAGMNKAEGSGVQSRQVQKPPTMAKSEKKKGFKLSGGGQTVGGDSGGVTEAVVSEEDAIEKADGEGVASRSPKEISGTDASGAPSNSGAEEGGNKPAIDKAKGKGVASASPKSVDGKSSGGSNGKAIEKAKGDGIASRTTKPDGMKEGRRIITLPHDVLVEDENGNQKTLSKGTKVVIGEMGVYCPEDGMGADMGGDMGGDTGMGDVSVDDAGMDMSVDVEPGVDEDLVTRIVSAVLDALHGGGEYDYAMEGKEIEFSALFEDTKKLLAEKYKSKKNKKNEEVEECMESKRREKKFGSILENDDMGEMGEMNDVGGIDDDMGEMNGMGDDIDKDSPDYIAALISDISDDFENLKAAMGIEDEEDGIENLDYDEEGEGEEEEEVEEDLY